MKWLQYECSDFFLIREVSECFNDKDLMCKCTSSVALLNRAESICCSICSIRNRFAVKHRSQDKLIRIRCTYGLITLHSILYGIVSVNEWKMRSVQNRVLKKVKRTKSYFRFSTFFWLYSFYNLKTAIENFLKLNKHFYNINQWAIFYRQYVT